MNIHRRKEAHQRRVLASQLAHDRVHPIHIANDDEQRFKHDETSNKDHPTKVTGKSSHLMSYTKGLPHNKKNGLVDNPDNFQLFIKGIDSGDPRDFRDTPLGREGNSQGYVCSPEEFKWLSEKAKKGNKGGAVDVRAWESQSAGLAFELEGPDPQAVTLPPAPGLGSEELVAEIAEVYGQALIRDIPFNSMSAGVNCEGVKPNTLQTKQSDIDKIKKVTDKLTKLDWFNKSVGELKLNDIEAKRQRCFEQTPSSAFRGITKGDDVGPYLSQFLLAGNDDFAENVKTRTANEGFINYGALTISQQVRTAKKGDDHMTTWEEWMDVQDGADLRGLEHYEKKPEDRFIYTPRDLATYVHYDALYEAYLNACLILLNKKIPFDPGIPFQGKDKMDHQQGFAHFGGPHILSLVTEVATRALKAVRYQKYNVHRRCRPEVLAARLYKSSEFETMAPEIKKMKDILDNSGIDLLSHIRKHNKKVNGSVETELLPMAFCEGSPMHPSYGAGHATVAGACVTILKAFFDHCHPLDVTGKGAGFGFVSIQNGNKLIDVPVYDKDCNPSILTVEGELNKLASNISIGRDWAGVHYFSDYYESILMGEQIAIGILEEQKLTYVENFSMTVPLFGGGIRRI